ncbi:MAG: hypothetical protein H3Z53_11370 [archaeon]|nr:hypothetical protein [archaeon]MCP8314952.1 hypothetical protein [archaeon]
MSERSSLRKRLSEKSKKGRRFTRECKEGDGTLTPKCYAILDITFSWFLQGWTSGFHSWTINFNPISPRYVAGFGNYSRC